MNIDQVKALASICSSAQSPAHSGPGRWLFALMIALLPTAALPAVEAGMWHAPRIKDYGIVYQQDGAAVPLAPERSYKLLFDVRTAGNSHLVPGLERVARFLNLAALENVPVENLDLAVIISGPATREVLDAEEYRRRVGRDNPNLDLLRALRDAGVRILVCSQALAHAAYSAEAVAAPVEIAVAAITVQAEFQLDGYLLMPD